MSNSVYELTMPSFGADMDQGLILEWLVKPGDKINKGQVIAIIETQKGAIDFEAYTDGQVEELLVAEDQTVQVGTPIARLTGKIDVNTVTDPVKPTKTERKPLQPVPHTSGHQPSTSNANLSRHSATPYARHLAKHAGINLTEVKGSGTAGAILSRDIKKAHHTPHSPSKDSMREAIAAALSRSKREIPHYYLETTIDVQLADDWVHEFNRDLPPDQQVLLNALFHCAVAKALRKVPEFNGFYLDGHFSESSEVHLATGISIRGGGLISPAILNADQLAPAEMMFQLKDLSDRVRNGGLRSTEMTLATATLSSMGDRGVEKLFGIIYPPQVALIGMGKPTVRPWVVGSEVKPRLLVTATLAADHRATDGRQGARFLNQLGKLLQKPENL